MVTQAQNPDLDGVKRRQQQTWASGNYAAIGTILCITCELLCEAVDLRAGQEVLDVATGTGNTALAAARRFCEVTGIDYVPDLLDRARLRADVEGLSLTLREGDAENLPFPDASFDVVLSTFGVMFAPSQEQAARELVRVCRPGGKIGLASWTPDGFLGEFFRIMGEYVPPPVGVRPPVLWGSEERVRELFGEAVTSLRANRRSFVNRFRSFEHYLEYFRTNYGPTLKAFEALDAAGRDALARDMRNLLGRYNRADDGTLAWPQEYLEVVATKR